MMLQTFLALSLAGSALVPDMSSLVVDPGARFQQARYEPEARQVSNWRLEAFDALEPKTVVTLAALFKAAGVREGDTIIGYCHIGQQATAMLFAARTLGFTVLLYDGSFEDWSRQADYPVDNPSKK